MTELMRKSYEKIIHDYNYNENKIHHKGLIEGALEAHHYIGVDDAVRLVTNHFHFSVTEVLEYLIYADFTDDELGGDIVNSLIDSTDDDLTKNENEMIKYLMSSYNN